MDRRALDHSLTYVDSWLRWRIPRVLVPGCVVAVSSRGRVIFAEAYGDVGVQDVFRIASHSKSFTATAILQLVEDGRLHLDDAAADHLGWLAEHRDRRWRRVTLRQLLCHGAGVVRDGLDADFWELARPFPDAEQLRQEVLDADLVLEPNTTMKYSNFGYGVLGAVLEAVTGRTYAEHLLQRVVGPLGLKATTPEPTAADAVVTGYGRRHTDGTRRPVPLVDTRALAAATGFAAGAADLCHYFSAHLPGSGKLLSDESKREMQRVHWRVRRPGSPGDEDYGLGLELE
ncbi:MAG: serine hydrolase domain-containing protein, partial [Acidimicrobiales bacterium]